jgi:DnaJ-class molecular chaperone
MVVQCSGEIISEKDKCLGCKGSKVSQEKKVLEVHVEKGMQHGQKIVFQGQADEAVSLQYHLKCTCVHVFSIYLTF